MKLIKCPRCDLNYIHEGEKYCKVCLRDMKGEQPVEELELCSVCNAAPALPGRDVCLSCLKEMNAGSGESDPEEAPVVDETAIGLNAVSTMDEIIPEIDEDIPATEYGDIQNELSLESVIEDEDKDPDAEDEDKDNEI